jgi:hypothetical protein
VMLSVWAISNDPRPLVISAREPPGSFRRLPVVETALVDG